MSDNPQVKASFTLLDDAACDRLIDGVLQVMEDTGCLVKHEGARQLLADAGCTVEGEKVFMPRDLVRKCIASAPKDDELVIYDQEGNPGLTFKHGESHFGPAITTVFLIDPETGEKRRGTRADAANTVTLIDRLPNLEWASTLASVNDGEAALTDVYEVEALLKNTTKPIMYWASRPENLEWQHLMFEAVAGGAEAFAQKPFAITLVCPMDPLMHTEEGAEQLIYLAKRNSPLVYIAGAGMGSTSPITIAGSLMTGLADTLGGLVIHQLANPGAPFIGAKFSDNINMRTVTSYHSGPEFVAANMATADVFRRLGLPFCLNFGDSDSGVFDQVAAFDIAAQIQSAVLSGSTMNFASGALENGNVADYAVLVYNNEIIGYFRKLYEPFDIDEEGLQLESIDEVGPGGNFLSEEATLDNYDEVWSTEVFTPRSYDQWQEEGVKDDNTRLMEHARELVSQGPRKMLDESVIDAIDKVVAEAEAAEA